MGLNIPSATANWRYIGTSNYPIQNPAQVTYKNVQAALSWILADAGPDSPEILFVKPTTTHNQIAYDLESERRGRIVLENDGVLIPSYQNHQQQLEKTILTLSSQQPADQHINPLYFVIQPADTPLPPQFAKLTTITEQKFGQVRVLKVQ